MRSVGREEFALAVGRMVAVAGGAVSVRDWFCTDRRPYRYAHVTVRLGDDWRARCAELIELAHEICGHVSAHFDLRQIDVILSRDLDADEIAAGGGTPSLEVSRDVSLDRASVWDASPEKAS